MGEFARLGDVLSAAQFLVESWQVPKRNPGINMVGKVKANIERDQKKPGEHMLAHAVRGAAPVGIGGHPTVFSNRTQPVDDTPYREIWQQPHERVEQGNPQCNAHRKEN
jgi:hypothetical protein